MCPLDTDASTASAAVCRIPALATTHSIREFEIQEAGVLTGTWFGSNTDELPKFYDDSVMDDIIDDTASDCHVGINFKTE